MESHIWVDSEIRVHTMCGFMIYIAITMLLDSFVFSAQVLRMKYIFKITWERIYTYGQVLIQDAQKYDV